MSFSRISAVLAGLLILAMELPVLTLSFQFLMNPDSRMPNPLPDLGTFGPLLFEKREWVLEADGQPVLGRGDIADAIHRQRDRGSMAIRTHRTGHQMVVLQAPAENPKYPWNRISGAHWMTRLIWPATCVLLAIALLLASQAISTRVLLIASLLLYMGHISWITVSPYEFTGWWRTVLIVYESAILTLGPIAVAWCGIRLPSPLFSMSLKPVWIVLAGWGLLQTYVNLSELDSYRLLQPWRSWESLYDFTKLMVMLAAASVLVFRFLLLSKPWQARLKWSMCATVFSFCFYFLMGPFLLGRYLETFSAVSWIAGLAALSFPIGLAFEGIRQGSGPAAAIALAGSWRQAFLSLGNEAQRSGMQLLALYTHVGTEWRVTAAEPCGAASWPAWSAGENHPDDSELLMWRQAGERAVMVLGRIETGEPDPEALDRLVSALANYTPADRASNPIQ